jgi:hypothetical protein
MKKLTTAAISATCLVLGAGGATLYTQAATGPAVYDVYENHVSDEAAYNKLLPEVQKVIKEDGGEYIAGTGPLLRRDSRDAADQLLSPPSPFRLFHFDAFD